MDSNHLDNSVDDESTSSGINKLNHYCLAKVLMHLPPLERLEMAQVCKKWKEASELSWYNVKKLEINNLTVVHRSEDWKYTIKNIELEILQVIRKCGRYLRYLKVDICEYLPICRALKDNNCQNIIDFSIDISNINKYGVFIGNENEPLHEDLVNIILSMTKLKYLRVKIYYKASRDRCHEIFQLLPNNMEGLEFDVQFFVPYECMGGAPELSKFNCLRELTLKGFKLSNDELESIFPSKDTLIKLDLSWSVFGYDPLPVISKLENLETLILQSCTEFNVDEITSITRNCLKLKHFEFIGNSTCDGDPIDLPDYIIQELINLNFDSLNID